MQQKWWQSDSWVAGCSLYLLKRSHLVNCVWNMSWVASCASRRGQKATNVAVYNACQYHQMSTYYRIQYLFFGGAWRFWHPHNFSRGQGRQGCQACHWRHDVLTQPCVIDVKCPFQKEVFIANSCKCTWFILIQLDSAQAQDYSDYMIILFQCLCRKRNPPFTSR